MLMGFLLLLDLGEKVMLGLIVFLVFFVFMLLIVENMFVIFEYILFIGEREREMEMNIGELDVFFMLKLKVEVIYLLYMLIY